MKRIILSDLPAALRLRLPSGLGGVASARAEALAEHQASLARSDAPTGGAFRLSRRSFIRSAVAATALAAGLGNRARACPATQADIEGPYYRAGAPFRQVLFDDSYFLYPLFVWGQVLDTNCQPQPGALLDFWQADSGGEYDNSSAGYQGRGRQVADPDGIYWFFTTWPGYYQGRPWHLHLKASQTGYRALTTQLYFRDDPRPHPQALEMDWFEFKDYPGIYGASFNVVLNPA